MAAASTPERVLMRLRRKIWRLCGPLARKRSGYFFIWSRSILARMERLTTRRPQVGGLAPLSLDDLSTLVVGGTYSELEPPAVDVVEPAGWVWPPSRGSAKRPLGTLPRGHGVVEIPGGVVFGGRGQFGPNPTSVFVDACSLWPRDTTALLTGAARALDVGLEELDGVSMNLTIGPSNYGHCLLQSVPCLDLLRRAFGLEADRFLVRADALPPTIEALAILGVPPDRVQVLPSRNAPAYRCERLRAATPPFLDELGISWTADFLHQLFLPVPPNDHSRRIYVPRGVSRRAVLNEDEVLKVLEPAGFEVVTTIGRTVAEQAAMFASAEVVVASHGSALANLVFAREGTRVIDLIGTNTASDEFAFLAWRRGLRYQMILGTEPTPPPRWWTWQFRADTIVDVRELRNRLERLDLL